MRKTYHERGRSSRNAFETALGRKKHRERVAIRGKSREVGALVLIEGRSLTRPRVSFNVQ